MVGCKLQVEQLLSIFTKSSVILKLKVKCKQWSGRKTRAHIRTCSLSEFCTGTVSGLSPQAGSWPVAG